MILAVIGVLLIASSLMQEIFTERMKWSDVKNLVSSGQVTEVVIDGDTIELSYRNEENTALAATGVYIPEDKDFLPLLEENKVTYSLSLQPFGLWSLKDSLFFS